MNMKPNLNNWMRAGAAMLLCLAFGIARAQDQDYGPVETDPPDRAARLSYLQGDVSLQPAGEQEWADAILNRPLTTGDKLWTDEGARAEIYVGPAAVRLGSSTGFSFLNVDDNTIQMRITAGVIDVSVRALDGNDQIEIDTPNLALSLLRTGHYRVEVNDEGDTTVVKVSEGEAEASGGTQNVIVRAQQAVTFTGVDQLTSRFSSLGAPDEFDSWSLERERRDDRAASSRTAEYVAPDVTGYEDLDDNGTWSSEAEYGYVWTPRAVAVDWSPYRYGRWAYVGPWGWTWIDDAPWGYAPFHYGRWAHVRDRWCWVPGPRHVRAVYAPALVGWVGSPGLNVSISVGGGGGVGWFPLGPREVYVPYRRYSQRYVERVNVHNTVIVNRTIIRNVYENGHTNVTYRNRGVPGGVTAVSRSTFTSSERVGSRRIRDERQFADRGSTAVAPRIDPVRESRLGSGDTRRYVRTPPQAVIARQVVVKRNPPPSGSQFTRSVGQRDARREQTDRAYRSPGGTPDRPGGNEWRNRQRPDNSGDANARTDTPRNVQDSRPVPNDRDMREGRTSYRQRTDRPDRASQPRTEVGAPSTPQSQPEQQRPIAVRQQEYRQREQSERQQQGRELQERRRAEVQTREAREPREQQQSVRERPVRAPQVEQPRAVAPQQPQQPREPREQRERPQPQQPAASPPQRQRDDNDDRGRRNDRR